MMRPDQRRARRPWQRFGLAVALLIAQACHAPEDGLALADAKAAAGQYEAAHTLLRQLLARPLRKESGGSDLSLTTQALVRLARLNTFERNDAPQALADWTALRAQYDCTRSQRLEALRQSADLLRTALGRPHEAVPLLREAAETVGAHVEGAPIRTELISLLLEQNNLEAAQLEAKALLERFEQTPEALRAQGVLGQIAFSEGRFAEAVEAYDALIARKPAPTIVAAALVARGDCLQELGNGWRALEAYFGALKDHSHPAVVQAKIARVRARLYHLTPNERILTAGRPSRHVAAWLPRPSPQDLGFDHVPPRQIPKLGPSRR